MKCEFEITENLKIVFEQNTDPDYSFELFISAEGSHGYISDIAYVGADYSYDAEDHVVQKYDFVIKTVSRGNPSEYDDVDNPDGYGTAFLRRQIPEMGMVPVGNNALAVPLDNGYGIAVRVLASEKEVYVGIIHGKTWWQNLLRLRVKHPPKAFGATDPETCLVRVEAFSQERREYVSVREPIVLKDAAEEEEGAEA